jgi:hypothetical protein
MKRFITSKAKQGEATKNHAMCALVMIPIHTGHGGKVGVAGRLVSSYLHCFQQFSNVQSNNF